MEINNFEEIENIQNYLINKIAEIIEVETKEIDINKSFSEYDLDSSSSIVLSGDLEEDLKITLDPLVLFKYPTVFKLSGYLHRKINQVN